MAEKEKKTKECLGCGQMYDGNFCSNCGKANCVYVDRNHMCRHTRELTKY